jgi:hypothetical protein
MPFADYENFDACVRDNSDKDDPEAYCAEIKRQVEGEQSLSETEIEHAERDSCPNGQVNVNGRCIEVKEVEDIPPSSLDMSNHRVLANRYLAGPIDREELSDNQVRYKNVALLDRGVWTDAGSGKPTEYDPAELEVKEQAPVNIMHDSESDASKAGYIEADSWNVEGGTGYADVVLNLDTSAGQYADETLQETLESGGDVGFGGPSIEIPAQGYDLEETQKGYPKLVDGVIEGMGFVRDPASKSTSFARQTAERGVAMSADSQTPKVYTPKDEGMSAKILEADPGEVREILDMFGVDTDDLDDSEVMDMAEDLYEDLMGELEGDESEMGDYEDDEEEDEEQEMQEGEEEEEEEEDEEMDMEELASEVAQLRSEIETIREEHEALMEAEAVQEELSAVREELADADTVQELEDAKEELDKRLSKLEEEPKDPKTLSDNEDNSWDPTYDNVPAESTGW